MKRFWQESFQKCLLLKKAIKIFFKGHFDIYKKSFIDFLREGSLRSGDGIDLFSEYLLIA